MNSRNELMRAIEEYFASMEIPQALEAGHVVGYLDELTAQGSSVEGLRSAWTDIELFVAYLENYESGRTLDSLEPWEFSRFVFEFLEKEVYDPESARPERKKQLMAVLVSLFGHLKKIGFIGSSRSIDTAYEKMFSGKRPKRLPRPPIGSGDLLGWLNGPITGLSHRITAADLWLALARDSDFDGEWKAMLAYIERTAVPDGEKKARAIERLASILSQDELDPVDFIGAGEPDKRLVERARKYFYRDDAVDPEPVPRVEPNSTEPEEEGPKPD